jgi:hypothetical protein
MERAAGRWRATTAEQGDLDAALRHAGHPPEPPPGGDNLDDALDLDLYASPLTNTLPLRRLSLLGAAAGTERTIVAAWVLLPSLAVVASQQRYTVLGSQTVQYASGAFVADLALDPDGYVTHYPGLADR